MTFGRILLGACLLAAVVLPTAAHATGWDGAAPPPRPEAGTVTGQASAGLYPRSRLDASVSPWRSLVALYIDIGRTDVVRVCTGSVVGDGVVLTAAHCLGGEPPNFVAAQRVLVVPGKEGPEEPFGREQAASWWYADGWSAQGGDPHLDYALVFLPDHTLTDRVGSFGKLTVMPDVVLNDPSTVIGIAGYPVDCGASACTTGKQSSDPLAGAYLWGAHGPAAATADYIFESLDTFGGDSGAPVYLADRGLTVGIVSRGLAVLDADLRLTAPIVDALQAACAVHGCQVEVAPPSDGLPRRAVLPLAGHD